MLSILDENPDIVEASDAKPILHARGDISFDDVSFAYDSGGPTLRNITCNVPAGTTVGIIGKTGAGKTTFVNLIRDFTTRLRGPSFLMGTI